MNIHHDTIAMDCYTLLNVSRTWRDKISEYASAWRHIAFYFDSKSPCHAIIPYLPYVSGHVEELIIPDRATSELFAKLLDQLVLCKFNKLNHLSIQCSKKQ